MSSPHIAKSHMTSANRHWMNTLLVLMLAGFSMLGTASAESADPTETGVANVVAATQETSAETAIDLATKEILALIERGQSYANEDPERFYVEAESLLAPLIDFPRFSRNVMGPFGRVATDAQRTRFAESFKWSLVRTYALALTEFREGEVKVLPPRRPSSDPNKANVMQEITIGGKAYSVAYLMRRSDTTGWRVRNMIIEGVNIGLNYKSQFSAAMKDPKNDGDLDRVIDAWSDFVAQAETVSE